MHLQQPGERILQFHSTFGTSDNTEGLTLLAAGGRFCSVAEVPNPETPGRPDRQWLNWHQAIGQRLR